MESTREIMAQSRFDNAYLLDYSGVNILLQSDYKFSNEVFEDLASAFANIVPDGLEGTHCVDGKVNFIPGDEVKVEYCEDHELTIHGPAKMFERARAITHIAGYMAECLRSSKSNRMLVHSAAVYSPESDMSYILIGEKGAGKTTLAIRLCREYGFEIVGNDQVYIGLNDESELVSGEGSKWIDIRETAVRADTYLGSFALDLIKGGKPCSWNNKLHINPYEIGIKPRHDDAVIDELFNVRIDSYQHPLYTAPWEGLQRNLILHEKIGRHVTGQATPFQNDQGEYLGSLPPINLSESLRVRDEIVGAIIKKGITELFGHDSAEIAKYIRAGL